MMGEDVTAVAPVKIIALALNIIAVIWLVVSIAGDSWVVVRFLYFEGKSWTWGLWKTCNKLDDGFNVCIKEDWITVCLVFSMMSLILSMAGTVCAFLGMRDSGTKTNVFYKLASGFLGVVAFLEFMVVVIFPVKFGHDITVVEAVRKWDFDWAYGFAWGGFIFSVGAALFYILPINCLLVKIKEVDKKYSKDYDSNET